MNKRLLKRHKRQVSRAKERVRLSEPDLRTPEQLTAAREASRAVASRRTDPRAPYSDAVPKSRRPCRSQCGESGRRLMIRATVGLFSTRCPHCRSIDFRSVGARNAMETAFQWLLQPYRCSLCGHRFFLFRWQVPVRGTA